jgi:hypothetical protein
MADHSTRLRSSLAAETLRDALLTSWLTDQRALMNVLTKGPVTDPGTDLPDRIARWIPEIEARWADLVGDTGIEPVTSSV